MLHTILTATDKLFEYGYFNDDGLFVGTSMTGSGFIYDESAPFAPISGKVKLMTETIYDKSVAHEVMTITVAKLPTADALYAIDPDYYSFTAFKDYAASAPEAKLLLTTGDDYFNTSTWAVNGLDLYGQHGNDTIIGGDGDDEIVGGGGNDTLNGGAQDDDISGGAGNDIIVGGKGNNVMSGGKGADHLIGDRGNDIMAGGKGSDRLTSGGGNDRLDGDSGADVFIFRDHNENAGVATIRDFDIAQDMLHFQMASDMTAQEAFDSFSNQAVQDGDTVVWSSLTNNIEVRMMDTDLSLLTADHFEASFAII